MKLPKTYINNLGSGNQRMYDTDISFMYYVLNNSVVPSSYEDYVSMDAIAHAFNNKKEFELFYSTGEASKGKLSSKISHLITSSNCPSNYMCDYGSISFVYKSKDQSHPPIHITFDSHERDKKIHCEFHYSPGCVKSLKFIHSFLNNYKIEKNPCSFSILYRSDMGLDIRPFSAKLPTNIDLTLNYGKDFNENIHPTIINRMKDGNGLYLFHGAPGTGKSTYIKYLASCLPEKNFLYIPDFMLEVVARPDAIGIFLENKNLVLVLEDAEKAITSREINENNSIISTLLNLTDGILSDILNLNVIVSYNTQTEKVDSALLRKGRLKYKYEFKEIPRDRVRSILLTMGFNEDQIIELESTGEIKDSMSIGEIYYILEKNGINTELKKKEFFGFN
jgi:hypothetical protein